MSNVIPITHSNAALFMQILMQFFRHDNTGCRQPRIHYRQ